MLLLTDLWNASPSVCEETSQDLPPQLLPRCAGFAHRAGNLQQSGSEPQCTPRIALSSAHLSRPQSQESGAGGRDDSDTVPAHQESSRSAGGGSIHINYSGPGWLGTSAQIQGERQPGLKRGRGLFLYQSQGQGQSQRWGSAGPSSCFSSPGHSSAWKGSGALHPSPLLGSGCRRPCPSAAVPAIQSLGCPSPEADGVDVASQLLTLPHRANESLAL